MTNQHKTADAELLSSLFAIRFGKTPTVAQLPGAGSDRRYFRLSDGEGFSVIGTVGDDLRENNTFISLARTFRSQGLPVPEIYAVSTDTRAYLQEDFGGRSLLDCLQGEERIPLAAEALRQLVKMQSVDETLWIDEVASAPFSRRQVMWDLNYFKYEFLKTAGILFDEEALEDDFEKLASLLTSLDPRLMGFMYRDFQSRNIIVREGSDAAPEGESRLGFIDFQGGRKGPVVYDAISFLWQAKAGFTSEERSKLLAIYINELEKTSGVDGEVALNAVGLLSLFRTLQVLGAYGFRGLVEKKAHFIESIPAALGNLRQLVETGQLDAFPELLRVAEEAVASRFARKEERGQLKIKVFSFSYKKGYPEDLSGNGGGFMFDCRGMHNPGRYDEYKPLTGLDLPVREFLEARGEVGVFIERVLDLLRPTVSRYLERHFDSLQIGFGCTGGRHRSVYCAQAVAEALAAEFPEAAVLLNHREQGITTIYNKKNTEQYKKEEE